MEATLFTSAYDSEGTKSSRSIRTPTLSRAIGASGGCPLMFDPTADFVHKAIRVACTLTGTIPKQV
jgi:hypothetical protein